MGMVQSFLGCASILECTFVALARRFRLSSTGDALPRFFRYNKDEDRFYLD
jgi:hypothetical protein